MKIKILFYSKVFFYSLVTCLIMFESNRSFGYEWSETFGGSGMDEGNSVQQTTDGGYIIVGTTNSFGAGDGDVYLVKTNADGKELWSKTFGGAESEWGNSVQQTADGGYIIAGTTNSFDAGDGDVYLIKTDADGNEEWNKTFGGIGPDWGHSVQQTTDGGYTITGSIDNYAGVYGKVLLMKLDPDGNEQWSKSFRGGGSRGHSVQQTNDSGYILAGGGWGHILLIKTDADGNQLWDKDFFSESEVYSVSIQQTTDGGYVIVGTSDDDVVPYGGGGHCIKTDSDGNELWRKDVSERYRSVRHTSDGGYIIAGSTNWGDVYLIKIDAVGNELWSKTFGGTESEWGNSVQQTTDDGYVITGTTSSFGADGEDVYLVYYRPNDKNLFYTPVTPCRIVDTRTTLAGIIGTNTQRNFHVFGSGSTISTQGGNSDGCPAPMGEPLATLINMIAVNPTGKGNLQAFPEGAGPGAGLSVNYNTIDTNLANAGTVKAITGPGPEITVASNFSSAHTVIDVLGYYYPDEGLLYAPVMPCRIVDTRYTSAGIIDADTERNFRVFGSGGTIFAQGGNPDGCFSPLGEPLAAHINLVAVNPYGKGNLQTFPVGADNGTGLSVNYNIFDTNLANAGTIKTNEGAGADITVASNFSSANTVIDVLGYYYPDGDLLYSPVKPCRIVDTRKTSAGIIDANTERNFRVFGPGGSISAQGGNISGCPSPQGEPLAAHINMIAVNPTGKGNLQVFPVGAGAGTGLSVNYNTIDTNLANAVTIKTVTGSGADITVASNFSSAHTVVDVLGYYYASLHYGLVASYPFNGNADDESGNGHHCTVHGATLTADRFGNADSAYRFDGEDDYIEMPELLYPSIETLSFAAWAWVTEDRPYGHIIYKGTIEGESTLWFSSDIARFDVKLSNGLWHAAEWEMPYRNKFVFLVGNYYRGSHLELWINGELKVTKSIPAYDLYSHHPAGDTYSSIGAYNQRQQGISFEGLIDDVRIYGRALSKAEINALYNLGN